MIDVGPCPVGQHPRAVESPGVRVNAHRQRSFGGEDLGELGLVAACPAGVVRLRNVHVSGDAHGDLALVERALVALI